MPRLIDDIRATGRLQKPYFVLEHLEDKWKKHTQSLWPMLNNPNLTVLLIDNVSDYYYQSDQEHWDLRRDFPNLAPPFPQFWAEHRIPPRIHSKEEGDTDMSHMIQNGRVGALITAIDPADAKGEGIPENTHWLLYCEIFIDYGKLARDLAVTGPHGSIFMAIDKDGALLDTPWIQSFSEPEYNHVLRALVTWLHPTLLAVCFLHCKNVTVTQESMPAPLAKKFRAKHPGLQPTRFRTLVIEPLKQILRTQGRSGEVGVQKAMHICRGHFRDYREGAGLFGKIHALVWTPMTVRGTKGEKTAPREIKVKI